MSINLGVIDSYQCGIFRVSGILQIYSAYLVLNSLLCGWFKFLHLKTPYKIEVIDF